MVKSEYQFKNHLVFGCCANLWVGCLGCCFSPFNYKYVLEKKGYKSDKIAKYFKNAVLLYFGPMLLQLVLTPFMGNAQGLLFSLLMLVNLACTLGYMYQQFSMTQEINKLFGFEDEGFAMLKGLCCVPCYSCQTRNEIEQGYLTSGDNQNGAPSQYTMP